MTVVGFIILLVVAFVAGALGEAIAGRKVPGGWFGSVVAGLVGAWLGARILHFGPVLGGVEVIPAIIGAGLFVLFLRLVLGAGRRVQA
ncbi:MAG: hypothetical protein RL653_2664 [Pseudomonadota bacterium]|jgi:uncharacterized membrane protein YeaQ/YmgE (transglycosylase-associated protein family)